MGQGPFQQSPPAFSDAGILSHSSTRLHGAGVFSLHHPFLGRFNAFHRETHFSRGVLGGFPPNKWSLCYQMPYLLNKRRKAALLEENSIKEQRKGNLLGTFPFYLLF
jgi:hypothetical protein